MKKPKRGFTGARLDYKIVASPDRETKAKWGQLAHLTEEDRNDVLHNSGHGAVEEVICYIESELRAIK